MVSKEGTRDHFIREEIFALGRSIDRTYATGFDLIHKLRRLSLG